MISDIIASGLERDGRVMTIFSGRSMLPTLRNGIRLLVEKIPPEDVRVSDIIIYKEGDSVIAHRVIKIILSAGRRVFVTKGDNHAYVDCSYVPQGDLMGIVRSAFIVSDLGKDVLIKSRVPGLLYAAAGNMALTVRNKREHVPKILRSIFKYFVGGFFFICKKFIHAVYMGIYHVRLLDQRRAGAF